MQNAESQGNGFKGTAGHCAHNHRIRKRFAEAINV
jgi:hypothetical protein